MAERQCFFTDIFNNLMDNNLSKVSTDAKADPEFIKPKRREIPYCKDNHICVYFSDFHFAKSLSCPIRNVEQNARICLLMGTWLDILDVALAIMCGDDRFILCADAHFSDSFVSLYAIGEIAKMLIFVIIAPQGSLPVRRNRHFCNHALSPRSAIVRSKTRHCVRYLSQPFAVAPAAAALLACAVYMFVACSGLFWHNLDRLCCRHNLDRLCCRHFQAER